MGGRFFMLGCKSVGKGRGWESLKRWYFLESYNNCFSTCLQDSAITLWDVSW